MYFHIKKTHLENTEFLTVQDECLVTNIQQLSGMLQEQ